MDTTAGQVEFFIIADTAVGAALADTIDAIAGQTDPNWRLTVVADTGAPGPMFRDFEQLRWIECPHPSSAEALKHCRNAPQDWVCVLRAGEIVDNSLVETVRDRAGRRPELRMVYTDHMEAGEESGGRSAHYKPEFNKELLRSMPYMGRACLIRQDALSEARQARLEDIADVYDATLRIVDQFGEHSVGHIAKLLLTLAPDLEDAATWNAVSEALVAHLARNQLDASVEHGLVVNTCRVNYRHKTRPLVTIIIPTRDHCELLRACIEHLISKTSYENYEVLVMDNGSEQPDTLEYFKQLRADARVSVVRHEGEFNFSAINNAALVHARGEYLLLLNNDTVVVQEDWLDRMLAQGQRAEVGVVGARLVYPDQTLQHAGIILGMGENGVAEHPFRGKPLTASGYMKRAQVAQELTAVTGACLLIRRSVYEEVGGLDEEALAVMYNDVDLCLKVRDAGYRVIWTPYATLLHYGSASLNEGHYHNARNVTQARDEVAVMIGRWLPKLARDPSYNPNLSLGHSAYDVDREVAAGWDEKAEGPRIIGMGLGSLGSLRHRLTIPLDVLQRRGQAATHAVPVYDDRVRVASVAELAREAPDALLAHNALHEVQLEALENYRRFNKGVLLAFGQDDLMIELPHYNEFRKQLYPDIRQRLRRAMRACDRLIVTSEALADAYRGWAEDVAVVPNYLDGDVWGHLRSLRRQGSKPRVGWAGAQQHSGDLEVIFDVVKETAEEVQWVFFGLCFKEWAEYGVEVHDPVDFDRYPETLAGLNLDLAVAPLAHNRFNQCKSNLKLLEYGALGIPVVCTDIDPYRTGPVARVRNTKTAWLNAIRERSNDLDAAAREGDVLRNWVIGHWMLDDNLERWLHALGATEGDTTVGRVAGVRG